LLMATPSLHHKVVVYKSNIGKTLQKTIDLIKGGLN
jgi:hypothetical protein